MLELGFGTGELLAEAGGWWKAGVWAGKFFPLMQAVTACGLASAARLRRQAMAQAMPFAAGAFDSILATAIRN